MFKLNCLFFNGRFKVRKPDLPRKVKTVKRLIGGNNLSIRFARRTFNLIIVHNIRHYIFGSTLKDLITKCINDELKCGGIDPDTIITQLNTIHLSASYKIPAKEFLLKILFPFCEKFGHKSISISVEAGAGSESTNLSTFAEALKNKEVVTPCSVSVQCFGETEFQSKTKREKNCYTLKAQFNSKTQSTHLTAILTDLFPATEEAIRWIETKAAKYEALRSISSTRP